MDSSTEILQNVRHIIKYYEKVMKKVSLDHNLNLMEINILSFLHYNPQKDTAKDIVHFRMLPKGNVSQGVEKLIQKELLKRKGDVHDRRKIHLLLTPKADSVIKDIVKVRIAFADQLFHEFSHEEKEIYRQLNRRISSGILKQIETQEREEKEDEAR